VASLLEKEGDSWKLHAQAWTVSLPDESMQALADSAEIGKPAAMGHDVEPDAAIAVNWMNRHLEKDGEQLEGRTDTLFAGSAPDRVAIGDKAVNEVMATIRERRKSGQANFSRKGGAFGRSAGEKAVYVLYHMVDKRTPLTFRAFQFFLREGDKVRPVLSLMSVAMPPRDAPQG
jgi:hypothetical protein